jgi:hypothetical protein
LHCAEAAGSNFNDLRFCELFEMFDVAGGPPKAESRPALRRDGFV